MASNANLDVRPSDLDQALVRVVFVSAVVVWSYANAPASSPLEALHYKYFTLAFSYWTFSLLAYGWTYFFIQRVAPDSAVLIASRIISIFADIGAISSYTAISDSFGVILFPIYLNSIIGYGYRFATRHHQLVTQRLRSVVVLAREVPPWAFPKFRKLKRAMVSAELGKF